MTLTQIDVDFTTGGGVRNGDVTDGELWLDLNNNGSVDGEPTDTRLKDNVTPASGTLSFSGLSQAPDSGTQLWQRSLASIRSNMASPGMQEWWNSVRGSYTPAFEAIVDETGSSSDDGPGMPAA